MLLPSTGPGNHGVRYIPGLSLGVIFQQLLAEMDDMMSTQQSIDNLRSRPGVPSAASFFMMLKKDSMFKEKHWTANPFEVIGASLLSAVPTVGLMSSSAPYATITRSRMLVKVRPTFGWAQMVVQPIIAYRLWQQPIWCTLVELEPWLNRSQPCRPSFQT